MSKFRFITTIGLLSGTFHFGLFRPVWQFLPFDFDFRRHFINFALLGGMCIASVFVPTGCITINLLLTIVIIWFNYQPLLRIAQRVLKIQ